MPRNPAEGRAALADSLLDSLDAEVDANAEEAWRDEICRRIQEIDGGAVMLIPWRDAQSRCGLVFSGNEAGPNCFTLKA